MERRNQHHREADELFGKSKSLGVDPRSVEIVEKRVKRIEGVIESILQEHPQWRP